MWAGAPTSTVVPRTGEGYGLIDAAGRGADGQPGGPDPLEMLALLGRARLLDDP